MYSHEKSQLPFTDLTPKWRRQHDEIDTEENAPSLSRFSIRRRARRSAWSWNNIASAVVITLLSATTLLQGLQLRRHNISLLPNFTYTIQLPQLSQSVPRLIHAPSDYLSQNSTWDEIDAGHGVVALDTKWAVQQGLPKTMSHPRDPTKSIYTIAAYHSIHCLKFVRQHYLSLIAGEPVRWDIEHDMHCFDGLRQMVMCDANSNLLWSTGRKDVGHGQTIMCRNWDALRDWASENTACYSDLPYPSKITRWGRCDGGDDGLPRKSLLQR